MLSFSSNLIFGAKSRKHLSSKICFYIVDSSGSPLLLSAVFVINDSSRRIDWPWCYYFAKETTLFALTDARAFNIRTAAS